jgi:hypothetical protein
VIDSCSPEPSRRTATAPSSILLGWHVAAKAGRPRRLDDALLERAKREAERRGETLTALIERGLRPALARPDQRYQRRRVEIPVCREGGGTLPGVDLDDGAALLDIVEGRK